MTQQPPEVVVTVRVDCGQDALITLWLLVEAAWRVDAVLNAAAETWAARGTR